MESSTLPTTRAEPARHAPTPTPANAAAAGDHLAAAQAEASRYLQRVQALQARYRAGEIHVHLPPRFADPDRSLAELVESDLPASQAALDDACDGLFYSLPVAFDPAESVGPYLATVDRGNTTWEGDSVGMLRLLGYLDRLDLEQVRRTGALAREGLEQLARDCKGLLQNVRGRGCLLAFDVVRADLREWLRDRAFRNGLLLLPAGERTLRFYPRYDMEPASIQEALALLRRAVTDVLGASASAGPRAGPEVRGGTIDVPPGTLQLVDLNGPLAGQLLPQVHALEAEQYGRKEGREPLLQYPPEALESTLGHTRAVGSGCGTGSRGGWWPTPSAARSRTTTRSGSATTRASATTTRSTCRPWRSRPSSRTRSRWRG